MHKLLPLIRAVGGRLIAISFGILTAWLLLEILLRLFYPALPFILKSPLREIYVTPFSDKKLLPPPIILDDRDYQHVIRNHAVNDLQYFVPDVPLHVTTSNWLDPNSHVGFRVPTPDWEPRWPVDALFIGDSFTFCFTEYEDCWVQMLADKYGMSVVNMGQGATGSIGQLHLLRKFGLLNEPRFVVWQWYGNDFNEDYGMATTYLGMEPVEPPTPKPDKAPRTPLQQWLSANSASYVIVNFFRSSEAEQYQYTRFIDPYHVEDGDVDIEFGRQVTIVGQDLSLRRNQVGLELSKQAIRKGYDYLTAAGVPLVLVLLPTKEEVYAHLTEPVLGEGVLQALSEGREQMREFYDAEGYMWLDATEALSTAAKAGQQLYFKEDNHLNPNGNAVLADVVWAFLVEQGLMAEQ